MKYYVVGFLFSPNKKSVALIHKKRPAWQAGKLNGIGGHIEIGEIELDAMVREFREETGARITDWRHFCTISQYIPPVQWRVFFYSAVGFPALRSLTDEKVEWHDIATLNQNRLIVPNLRWLIPFALEGDVFCSNVEQLNWKESD